jgi:hypothetical protein
MNQSLHELLEKCTVKLNVPGGKMGTGFFVAPQLILTCAHVLKDSKSSKIYDGIVEVVWQDKPWNAALEQLPNEPEKFDLVLLRVYDLIPNAGCVFLDKAFRSGDKFYTFGYTDLFPNGASVTANCDGFGNDNRGGLAKYTTPVILFKGARVRSGLSGSPLLNERTGAVCGVVMFTHDKNTDLGGGAIPTSAILDQFPKLEKLQQQFHQNDQCWEEAASRDSQLTSSQELGLIVHRAIELGQSEAIVRTILAFPSVIGGAIGAGLGMGILRAVIALLANQPLPCVHFAMSFFSASILGAATTLGMALTQSQSDLLDRLRDSKKGDAPEQKQISKTAIMAVFSGALFFGIAHTVVALINGLPVFIYIKGIYQLSPQLLVLPMGFLAGLGLSIVLYDQPWLDSVPTKRGIPHPNRCGLRFGLAALVFALIQGVFILAKVLAKIAEEKFRKEGEDDIVVEAATGIAIARTGEFYKAAFTHYENVPGWRELMQLCPQWFDYLALLDAALVGMVLTLGIVIGSILAHRWSDEWLKLINRQNN